ncbi:MAG: glycerol-3-phosphate acyltransferase, partial [Pseudanabaenales cyanobacterium]|nr:glycerol-3-phosphate acyltransferase [Pseudanabaenales cyanobacterium]
MAYMLGSIPTGYWLAKFLKGIDIRQHGSGSTGATNVLRVVGKKAAL